MHDEDQKGGQAQFQKGAGLEGLAKAAEKFTHVFAEGLGGRLGFGNLL